MPARRLGIRDSLRLASSEAFAATSRNASAEAWYPRHMIEQCEECWGTGQDEWDRACRQCGGCGYISYREAPTVPQPSETPREA